MDKHWALLLLVCLTQGEYVEVDEIIASSILREEARFLPYFAINGNISKEDTDFLHTNDDDHSFVQLKMSEPQMVAGVEIFNRVDCCGDRLKNVEIRGGLDRVPVGSTGMYFDTK
eukprot:TRINITY_DN31526_c0_g1_i1.p1 TRINITY_DN31526_c0_g1~~TRINITY_DN31526_c0_g1_i1.p1  ORF type:complete len:115 (-),score=13.16 TRINITY_DN31526_c0_g1_i1:33-377(-)